MHEHAKPPKAVELGATVAPPEHSAGTGKGEGFASGGAPAPANDAVPKATELTGPGKVVVSSQALRTSKTASETRRIFGIGEQASFVAEAGKAGSGEGVEGTWSATIGTTAPNAAEGNMKWTAPATAGKGGVTFTPKDGGTATTIQVEVVAPDKLTFTRKSEITTYGKGVQGAGMLLDVKLEPLTVSFAEIAWQESAAPPTNITGSYATASPAPQAHVPASPDPIFGNDNMVGGDKAEFTGATGVLKKGGYDWVIPQAYVVKGTVVSLGTVTQSCRMEDGGTTTTTKAGNTVTRSP